MDLNDLTPAGAGSLRAPAAPAIREPVGTFSETRVQHPDEIWNPRGSEIGPPQRPLGPAPGYSAGAGSERSVQADTSERPTAGDTVRNAQRTVRAALRPATWAG
jgi:hypothetical protein